MARTHLCPSYVTLEGSRSALIMIFDSGSIWAFQGEKNVWGFVYFIVFCRTMFVQKHVKIEIWADDENPLMHLVGQFRGL